MKGLTTYVVDVESMTLRDVAGDGSRTELSIKTKGGTWTLDLIARKGKTVRLVDLRARDKARSKKARAGVDVIMKEAGLMKWGHVR